MKRLRLVPLVVALLLASLGTVRVVPNLLGSASAALDPGDAGPTRVRLTGHVPISVQDGRATKIGPTDSTETIVIALSTRLRDEATLNALVGAVSDPTSPSYGHYLSPTEFSARFGATDADRNVVERFLARQGLREIQTFNNGTLIIAEAPAAVVATAFGVELARFRAADGSTFRAPTGDPLLPGDVANIVVHVAGLDSLPVARVPRHMSTASTAYTPAQLATAYDATPLLGSGISGVGETVASVQLARYARSDVNLFNSRFVHSIATLQDVPLGGGATSDPNGDVETTLDIELQMAAAPGAPTILEYNAPIVSQAWYDAMFQKIADDNRATTVSTSWGLCEPYSSSADITALHNAFIQMASQGQTFFAASGDDGSEDCYSAGGPKQFGNYVDYPASDDHVTAVGGTTLTTSNGSYASETTWNQGTCTPSGCGSGGGGLSRIFLRPAWQFGLGTTNQYSNGMRQVPDISLDADPNPGYVFVYNSLTYSAGGTSAGAPTWAGYAAVYNQYARSHQKPRLGFANPALYGVGNSTSRALAFHDVTAGTNIAYPATDGYDLATGWGSPDVNNLVVAMDNAASTSTPTGTPTLTPTPTITATSTPTFTVTPSSTATRTPTFTPTPTITSTSTPTFTVTPTSTASKTPTFTVTPTSTATRPPTFTVTPTSTATRTQTSTVTPTSTATRAPTITVTPTITATSTPTFTATPTVTATSTPTFTVTPTISPTSIPTFTATPTISPTGTALGTVPLTPTDTPLSTVPITPTDTPLSTVPLTPTDTPSATPTIIPSAMPTDTPSATPTVTPSTTPTVRSSCTPSAPATPVALTPPPGIYRILLPTLSFGMFNCGNP